MTNQEAGNDIKRCVRCVMPETYPGITFNAEGVCNICQYFDANWGSFITSTEERQHSDEKLRKIFDAAKKKRKPYDALVGISGGKDSSYCLYLCTQVYGLNVLAFTKVSCFLSDDAPARIDKLVETFKVPHLYYQDPLSPELAGIFMRKTGNFCTACELSAFNTTSIIAQEYDIPIIIMGNSSRSEAPPPKSLNPWDASYFSRVMKGEGYRERIRNSIYSHNFLISEGIARVLGRRRIVLLPDYVDWNEEKISSLFANEFGFSFGEEHADCWAHDVANYLYQRKCGGTHPMVAKYSMLVRNGRMSREEAIAAINDIKTNTPVAGLERLLEVLNMTREEFETASERSPQPYIKGFSRIFNLLRRKVRKQAF